MRLVYGITLVLFALAGVARSTQVTTVPDNNRHRWLHDDAGVMQVNHEAYILNKIRHIYDSCGLEIYVVVDEGEVNTSDSACMAFAQLLMEEWSLSETNQDVILIYGVTHASKVSVVVTPSLENRLGLNFSHDVLKEQLEAGFRQKQYGRTINGAISTVLSKLNGSYSGRDRRASEGIPFWVIVVIAAVLLYFFSTGGSRGKTYQSGAEVVLRNKDNTLNTEEGHGGGFGGSGFTGGGAGGSW